MKKLSILSLVLALFWASKSSAQIPLSDTVTVYIERKLTDADGKYHLWYSKVEEGRILNSKKDTLFYSVCDCPAKKLPEKGDYSKILRSQMVYVTGRNSWRKINN